MDALAHLMCALPNRYRWEAELPDGTLVTTGADLTAATRFSLRPQMLGIPRHDIVGVPMNRRFGRGFIHGLGGGMREYMHCIVLDQCRMYVRCTDGAVVITPVDYELYL